MPDHALVVSALFQLAEKEGKENITIAMVMDFVNNEFKLGMPLHAVCEIFSGLEIMTIIRKNKRYIVWNEKEMKILQKLICGDGFSNQGQYEQLFNTFIQ